MKKTILIMLLIPKIVLASTIYTEYEPYKLNTDEYMEETDTLKREEIKLYNTYKKELEVQYLSLEDTLEEYELDYNNFILEDKNTLESNQYSYNYQTKCLNNNYQIKSIVISDFSNDLEIGEARIYHSSESLTYNIGVQNFEGFISNITDKNYFDNSLKINSNSKINFGFYKDWNLEDLTIKLFFPKQMLNSTIFKITLNKEIELIGSFILPNQENNIITINFDNNYNDFLIKNNFVTSNKCISYFSSKIPLYKHSKINLIPLNNYIPLNSEDLFLLEDYQIKYNYYKREKVEIYDNIILNGKEFNINDYIKSSTIPIDNLSISHNINYEKEGNYHVNIYYQNKLLKEQEIQYNIIENKYVESKETESIKPVSIKTTKTKEINTTKVTTNNVKQLNDNSLTSVKENKYQKSIYILVISILLILLIIFECTLLYVKKKYY